MMKKLQDLLDQWFRNFTVTMKYFCLQLSLFSIKKWEVSVWVDSVPYSASTLVSSQFLNCS